MTDLVLLVNNKILSVQTLPLVILGQFRGGGAGGVPVMSLDLNDNASVTFPELTNID